MKISVGQLRNVIREAIRDFKDQDEFKAELSALDRRATDYRNYANAAEGGSWYEENQIAKNLEAQVAELQDFGRKKGWLPPLPHKRTPDPLQLKIGRDPAASQFEPLMKKFPGKEEEIATAWDELVELYFKDVAAGEHPSESRNRKWAEEFSKKTGIRYLDMFDVIQTMSKYGGSTVSGQELLNATKKKESKS